MTTNRAPILLALAAAALCAGALCAGALAQRSPAPAPDEVSYDGDIAPIVQNFCATCHHGADPDGGFVLDTYADVRDQVEKGELLGRINDTRDPMPPAGLLPKEARELFEAWAEGGYVEEGEGRGGFDWGEFVPPTITPVDIEEGEGFELLERMQGHWVGRMNLMGEAFPWFAFDYRAIAPSHVHGIFEGGTLGNLFTSFFVADYRGQKTIMARNGGILNGIYRTSYFVLDRVRTKGKSTRYRLVDARGGAGIMWMSLEFTEDRNGDRLDFRAYTSRMGLASPPSRHMSFQGRRMHPELAAAAAEEVGFPKRVAERDFSGGLPLPDWGPDLPVTSASYIWEDSGLSLEELAEAAGDPYRIDEIPHLAKLTVSIERGGGAEGADLLLYLSREALADESGDLRTQYGYLREDLYDGLLLFPELSAGEDEFTFTYLHPGVCYLTVIADRNDDGYASPGDLASPSLRIVVEPGSAGEVRVSVGRRGS